MRHAILPKTMVLALCGALLLLGACREGPASADHRAEFRGALDAVEQAVGVGEQSRAIQRLADLVQKRGGALAVNFVSPTSGRALATAPDQGTPTSDYHVALEAWPDRRDRKRPLTATFEPASWEVVLDLLH